MDEFADGPASRAGDSSPRPVPERPPAVSLPPAAPEPPLFTRQDDPEAHGRHDDLHDENPAPVPTPSRRQMSITAIAVVATLAIVAVVVVVAVVRVAWLVGGTDTPGDLEFVIEPGMTAAAIGEELVDEGIIRSSFFFRRTASIRNLDQQLQAGTYTLGEDMSIDAVIDTLLDGPKDPTAYRFRVEEGLTVRQTLDRLAEQTPWSEQQFEAVLDARAAVDANTELGLQLPEWVPAMSTFGPEVRSPFEGLLQPNTYEVVQEATPQEILQRMIDQLAANMDEMTTEDLAALDARDLTRYDALIIASMIERETRVDEERPIVSGVIRNRLSDGMRLQIDATVLYARGQHTSRVLLEDTRIESPYNTYRVTGLPPSPISGASAASILAAARPSDTDARYYVLDASCDGTHVFTETLTDHNRFVAAFRDAGGCL